MQYLLNTRTPVSEDLSRRAGEPEFVPMQRMVKEHSHPGCPERGELQTDN